MNNSRDLNDAAEAAGAIETRTVYKEPNLLSRVIYTALGVEIIPAVVRVHLMRALGFKVHPTATIWAHCMFRSNRVQIGLAAFINVGFFFDGSDDLFIGDCVRIGQFVRVITSTHDIGPETQRCTFEAVTSPVRIENGCWIGANTIILPGVTIAKGCVIGTGSLVMTSTEPNGVYVGSPARRIRDLPID